MMKHTIPELIAEAETCIMVPCVYDCSSARAAELAGYQAILLSGGEVGESLGAIDEEEMTEDELLFVASHICAYSPLPLVIDCGCFRPNPLSVLRFAKKFADAGAGALLIEDEDDVDVETFIKMVKAAVEGCRGTRCAVIARTNHPLVMDEDFDYVSGLLTRAVEAGACMTMACGLNSARKAERLAGLVPGPKMYPDQNSHDGIPEVVNEEIFRLGYPMISFHYAMKVSMAAMIRYGKEDLLAGNNLPSNEVELVNGYTGHSALTLWDYQGKYDRLAEITGDRYIFEVPGDKLD